MTVNDTDSTAIVSRHVFAALLAGGILYAGLGLGAGALVPFDGTDTSPSFAVTGDIGVRFGESGFYMAMPFAVDFVIGGRPLWTGSITLGFEAL